MGKKVRITKNKDGSINDPSMNISTSTVDSALLETTNDPIKSALQRYQPSTVGGTQEYLNTGKGYSKFEPFGKGYDEYKKNTEWYFDPSDPFKREQLMNLFNPDAEINQTPERQAYLEEIFQKHPEALTNPNKLFELAMDSKEGPVHSLIREGTMPLRNTINTGVTPQNPEGELAPVLPKTGTDNPPPPVDKENPRLGRYAGMLGNLAGFIPNKAIHANPSTFSSGMLKPELVDEQTMRSGIDAANRANTGALANVTGGSGAAQRAGLLAQGTGYMGATGNAFTQANALNNQARQQANQYNIGNQANVAAQNTGILNQFELENKQLDNDVQANNRARAEQAIKGITAEISDIGEQNYRGDILGNIYDYNKKGKYQYLDNNATDVNSLVAPDPNDPKTQQAPKGVKYKKGGRMKRTVKFK